MAKKKKTKKRTEAAEAKPARSRATKKRPTSKKTAKKKRPAARKTVKKTAAGKKTAQKKTSKTKAASNSKKKPASKKAPAKSAPAKAAPSTGSKKKASSSPKRRSTSPGAGRLRSSSVAEAASAASADAQGHVFINGRRVRMISTRHVPTPTKKPRATPATAAPVEPEPKPRKPIKSRLSPKTLNEYRSLLLIKRAELVGDLTAMEAEALQTGGNLPTVPIHMADIGTDTYDQDFMLGLAETERERLREIDEALKRIEDRTYGVCQMTGKPIPRARLLAKPWAKYTIESARKVEGSWGS